MIMILVRKFSKQFVPQRADWLKCSNWLKKSNYKNCWQFSDN